MARGAARVSGRPQSRRLPIGSNVGWRPVSTAGAEKASVSSTRDEPKAPRAGRGSRPKRRGNPWGTAVDGEDAHRPRVLVPREDATEPRSTYSTSAKSRLYWCVVPIGPGSVLHPLEVRDDLHLRRDEFGRLLDRDGPNLGRVVGIGECDRHRHAEVVALVIDLQALLDLARSTAFTAHRGPLPMTGQQDGPSRPRLRPRRKNTPPGRAGHTSGGRRHTAPFDAALRPAPSSRTVTSYAAFSLLRERNLSPQAAGTSPPEPDGPRNAALAARRDTATRAPARRPATPRSSRARRRASRSRLPGRAPRRCPLRSPRGMRFPIRSAPSVATAPRRPGRRQCRRRARGNSASRRSSRSIPQEAQVDQRGDPEPHVIDPGRDATQSYASRARRRPRGRDPERGPGRRQGVADGDDRVNRAVLVEPGRLAHRPEERAGRSARSRGPSGGRRSYSQRVAPGPLG